MSLTKKLSDMSKITDVESETPGAEYDPMNQDASKASDMSTFSGYSYEASVDNLFYVLLKRDEVEVVLWVYQFYMTRSKNGSHSLRTNLWLLLETFFFGYVGCADFDGINYIIKMKKENSLRSVTKAALYLAFAEKERVVSLSSFLYENSIHEDVTRKIKEDVTSMRSLLISYIEDNKIALAIYLISSFNSLGLLRKIRSSVIDLLKEWLNIDDKFIDTLNMLEKISESTLIFIVYYINTIRNNFQLHKTRVDIMSLSEKVTNLLDITNDRTAKQVKDIENMDTMNLSNKQNENYKTLSEKLALLSS